MSLPLPLPIRPQRTGQTSPPDWPFPVAPGLFCDVDGSPCRVSGGAEVRSVEVYQLAPPPGSPPGVYSTTAPPEPLDELISYAFVFGRVNDITQFVPGSGYYNANSGAILLRNEAQSELNARRNQKSSADFAVSTGLSARSAARANYASKIANADAKYALQLAKNQVREAAVRTLETARIRNDPAQIAAAQVALTTANSEYTTASNVYFTALQAEQTAFLVLRDAQEAYANALISADGARRNLLAAEINLASRQAALDFAPFPDGTYTPENTPGHYYLYTTARAVPGGPENYDFSATVNDPILKVRKKGDYRLYASLPTPYRQEMGALQIRGHKVTRNVPRYNTYPPGEPPFVQSLSYQEIIVPVTVDADDGVTCRSEFLPIPLPGGQTAVGFAGPAIPREEEASLGQSQSVGGTVYKTGFASYDGSLRVFGTERASNDPAVQTAKAFSGSQSPNPGGNFPLVQENFSPDVQIVSGLARSGFVSTPAVRPFGFPFNSYSAEQLGYWLQPTARTATAKRFPDGLTLELSAERTTDELLAAGAALAAPAFGGGGGIDTSAMRFLSRDELSFTLRKLRYRVQTTNVAFSSSQVRTVNLSWRIRVENLDTGAVTYEARSALATAPANSTLAQTDWQVEPAPSAGNVRRTPCDFLGPASPTRYRPLMILERVAAPCGCD